LKNSNSKFEFRSYSANSAPLWCITIQRCGAVERGAVAI
jgi:hypothetical protein